MDFSDIIQRSAHPALKWLGNLKEPWVKVGVLPDKPCSSYFEAQKKYVRRQPGYTDHAEAVERFVSIPNALVLGYLSACSAAIAKGPKIFFPTAEQYDSFQHVDMTIPISDYAQPYPAMVVKIPVDSRNALAQSLGIIPHTCPSWVLLHNFQTAEGANAVFMSCSFGGGSHGGGFEENYFFQDRPDFTTIEDALTQYSVNDYEIADDSLPRPPDALLRQVQRAEHPEPHAHAHELRPQGRPDAGREGARKEQKEAARSGHR